MAGTFLPRPAWSSFLVRLLSYLQARKSKGGVHENCQIFVNHFHTVSAPGLLVRNLLNLTQRLFFIDLSIYFVSLNFPDV